MPVVTSCLGAFFLTAGATLANQVCTPYSHQVSCMQTCFRTLNSNCRQPANQPQRSSTVSKSTQQLVLICASGGGQSQRVSAMPWLHAQQEAGLEQGSDGAHIKVGSLAACVLTPGLIHPARPGPTSQDVVCNTCRGLTVCLLWQEPAASARGQVEVCKIHMHCCRRMSTPQGGCSSPGCCIIATGAG